QGFRYFDHSARAASRGGSQYARDGGAFPAPAAIRQRAFARRELERPRRAVRPRYHRRPATHPRPRSQRGCPAGGHRCISAFRQRSGGPAGPRGGTRAAKIPARSARPHRPAGRDPRAALHRAAHSNRAKQQPGSGSPRAGGRRPPAPRSARHLMVKMILLAAALAALAFGQTVEEKETIQRTFPSVKRVEVENVFGSIRVAGYDGAAVELVAYETIRGESPEKVKQARLEVKLDISRDGDTLGIYVDGPFRCHCDDR